MILILFNQRLTPIKPGVFMKYIVLILCFLSNLSLASTEQGVIKRILVNKQNPNVVYMIVDGNNEGKPSCSTNTWEWSLDISTEIGKAQYSLALASHMANKTVFIQGESTCTLFSAGEDVRYIHTM